MASINICYIVLFCSEKRIGRRVQLLPMLFVLFFPLLWVHVVYTLEDS